MKYRIKKTSDKALPFYIQRRCLGIWWNVTGGYSDSTIGFRSVEEAEDYIKLLTRVRVPHTVVKYVTTK